MMVSIVINDHIYLQQLKSNDAGMLFDLVQSSRKTLRRFLPWVDYNTKPEHSQRFIELMLRKADQQEAIAFGMWYNGALCGVMDLHEWDPILQKAEIGYWIADQFSGKGIVSVCCSGLLDYAYATMRLNKVEIRFALENKKSGRIPIKLGFRKEGILRQSAKLHGQLVDMVVMGMLREDWEKFNKEQPMKRAWQEKLNSE
ncbi:ribosomal-protein-serine acetyltransferase [Chitinophaga skermanii]|uniref:Ribosomal-protein-serine acetyltransferase n=1 Tax=Chitinophaga skermanii TaxID=331697 RepID=A0A327QB36_9BACT|nr:GNAT family protein [Chitinophaga skermanii]RAJ01501.1 ribosomal-protein-serine acetyltransferase [Chitinophaga skermanii]